MRVYIQKRVQICEFTRQGLKVRVGKNPVNFFFFFFLGGGAFLVLLVILGF